MGYTYHELVPVAVLLDHSGINKDKFVKILNFIGLKAQEYSHFDFMRFRLLATKSK
jgi:hypothetical protein